MASQLTYECIENDDILEYTFNIDGNEFEFDIVEFKGLDDYKEYIEEDGEDVLFPLRNYLKKTSLIVGYDWDISKQSEKNINIFSLIRIIEIIGKEYVLFNWPDVIFYEAEDKRLHKIYERMFPSFGYYLTYSIGNNYVYTKFGRDIIKIIQEEI